MRKVLHLMATLSDDDVDWLIANGEPRLFPQDTTIILQGRPIEALFLLLEGRLSVRMASADDREVASLYPGEVLGEISFLDAHPPSASVIARDDSLLLVVPRAALTTKLAADDGFAARFFRGLAIFLADRLRTTTAHLGYGKWQEEQPEAGAIDDGHFDEISLAARRFDTMLRRLRLADGSA